MTMNYKTLTDAIILREGGYFNHPSDKGGPTMYGITQAVARTNGYEGDMREMPRSLAEAIYLKRYIIGPGFNKIATVSELLAEEMIDTGVNMGPAVPAPWLQRLLNLLNQRGTRYADVFVDGIIGPVTLDALAKFAKYRGTEGLTVLTKAMNSLQTARYVEIAEKKESQEDFIYGWLRTRT